MLGQKHPMKCFIIIVNTLFFSELKSTRSLLLNLQLHYFCLVTQSYLILFDLKDWSPPGRTGAHQAPLSMGFPRKGYWSGLTFPTLGDLPDPGIEPMLPALAGVLY